VQTSWTNFTDTTDPNQYHDLVPARKISCSPLEIYIWDILRASLVQEAQTLRLLFGGRECHLLFKLDVMDMQV
jgi:hypothetical protein